MVPDQHRRTERSRRGFASMDGTRQREIARKGGESVPAEKRSFSLNRELAAESGRKGGHAVADENRSFSQNRELAVEAGRKGGYASRERLARLRAAARRENTPQDDGEGDQQSTD